MSLDVSYLPAAAGPRPRAWVRPSLLAALAIGWLVPAGAKSQTLTTGALVVEVTSSSGVAVGGAAVTLSGRSTLPPLTTDRQGRVQAGLLAPGVYDIRAEALGYRPLVMEGVRIVPGEVSRVVARVAEVQPPVINVDTAAAPAVGIANPTALVAGPIRLRALPQLHRDLSELALMDPRFDPGLGSRGLPGRHTGLVVDGVPFTSAAHPWSSGRPAAGLPFSGASLGVVRMLPNASDIEWSGFAGALVAAETAGRPAHGAFVAGSTDALWSGEEVATPPSTASIWAAGATEVQLVPDTATLQVTLEGRQVETPFLPLADDSLAAWLARRSEIPPATVEALAAPVVRSSRVGQGTARLDWRLTDASILALRSSLAHVEGTGAGSGTSAAWENGLLGDGTDFSGTVQLLTSVAPRLSLELRGGYSTSSRTFTEDSTALPPTRFGRFAGRLGSAYGLGGSVQRRELAATAGLHWQLDDMRIKGGGQAFLTRHDISHLPAPGGFFLLSSGDAESTGAVLVTPGPARSAEFSIPEIGVFLQYDWDVVSGLNVSVGGRYDQEALPWDDIAVNGDWFRMTGLAVEAPEEKLDKVSARFRFSWDLTGQGTTFFGGTFGVQYGRFDPFAVAEAVVGDYTVRRAVGSTGWPDVPAATTSARRLTLLEPHLQAPRTIGGGVSLSHALWDGARLTVSGALRDTEYLLRRSDLNLTGVPAGQDPLGRQVFGRIRQEGDLLVVEPGSSRRFDGFEHVWALAPDGSSEYRDVSILLEHSAGDRLQLFGGYTYSETEDDLWGLASPEPEASLLPLRASDGLDWRTGRSDFDVPHRVAVGFEAALPLPAGGSLSGLYRFRSGDPFTPTYRGVDANGDGSFLNDPAAVPSTLDEAILGGWSCLRPFLGSMVDRNACRTPATHRLDLRLSVGLARLWDLPVELVIDGLNVTGSGRTIVDDALLLGDPQGTVIQDGESVVLPLRTNPHFGETVRSLDHGRWLRLGVRLGGVS